MRSERYQPVGAEMRCLNGRECRRRQRVRAQERRNGAGSAQDDPLVRLRVALAELGPLTRREVYDVVGHHRSRVEVAALVAAAVRQGWAEEGVERGRGRPRWVVRWAG